MAILRILLPGLMALVAAPSSPAARAKRSPADTTATARSAAQQERPPGGQGLVLIHAPWPASPPQLASSARAA